MNEPVIAIFEIGHRKKKLLLFNQSYDLVYEKISTFETILDDDGHACDNVQKLAEWIPKTLAKAQEYSVFDIKAVNFTAYGSALVYLDGQNRVVTPLYNYSKPYPEALLKQFYEENGASDQIALETASPPLKMLNMGFQLYWLKYAKPHLFEKVSSALFLPQFASYLISGQKFTEITYIGCHSALWDFEKQHFHQWVIQEKLDVYFPQIKDTRFFLKSQANGKSLRVGVGIHDSSSALVPYLRTVREPFVLLSTGTWNIALNPFNNSRLSIKELKDDCLTYFDLDGKPVKASRIYLGREHDHYLKILQEYFKEDESAYKKIGFDAEVVKTLSRKFPKALFGPHHIASIATFKSLKPTPPPDLSLFSNFKEAYYKLMIDLVALQSYSLDLVIKDSPVKKIFVTGGFSKNPVFIKLLAALYPAFETYTSNIPNATALGAAMVIQDQKDWNKQNQEILNFKLHDPDRNLELENFHLV
ncbi:MAG: FGGY-family carbohydrate kinase [Candidatus Cyclobacteriaceae bacterium M3_2C_046]